MKTYRNFIWKNALEYLSERVDIDILRQYMSHSDDSKPESFSEIYLRLLKSLTNKRNMPNSIGDVERLKSIFWGFDHKKTLEAYSDWQSLLQEIRVKINPSSVIDENNSHNYWVIFCKGALSSATWLNRFSTLEEFSSYVDDFDQSPNTRPALPFLMGEEIFGYGFALACDFLKESGFSNFSKPDIHLIDIFSGLGISTKAPIDIFRTVSLMAKEVGETPYAIDKVFWLIGSGKLYDHNESFKTDKFKFVEQVKAKWVL